MKRLSVLVTGGAGYIGSVIARQLADQGWDVVVVDSFLHQQTVNLPHVTMYAGTLLDKFFLRSIFKKHLPTVVVHCAGLIEVGRSVIDPAPFYAANLAATLVLLDCMREFDTKKIIFSSTSAVYGAPEQLPIAESAELSPQNPYARSKYGVEHILHDFVAAYGMQAVIFRYFNAAGALPEYGLGEQHKPETHVIPLLLDALLEKREFSIFGTDYQTSDGTCVRDYIHVYDVARAHVLAVEKYVSPSIITINLGTGRPFSVRELVDVAQQQTKLTTSIISKPRRVGDVGALVADWTAAREILGWQPQRSSIEEILQTAFYWQQQRLNIAKPTYHQVII